MQPGSLGTQDSEGWVRAEGLSVFRLETPRTGKGREDVQCSTYIAILTPRIISWSQAACRSDMETWTFWAPHSVWDSFIAWKWCKKSWSLFFPALFHQGVIWGLIWSWCFSAQKTIQPKTGFVLLGESGRLAGRWKMKDHIPKVLWYSMFP